MKYLKRRNGEIEPVFKTGSNDIERKYAFLKSSPELLMNQIPEYYPYYVTFTFQNTAVELPYDCYRDYFRFFYRRLDKMTRNRAKNQTNTTMILIPENSYHCTSNTMHSCVHFHGFIFIHNARLKKFNDKCVLAKAKESNHIALVPQLLNPYPQAIKKPDIENTPSISLNKRALLTDSVDVRELHSVNSLETIQSTFKTAFYSNKNFIKSSFSYDDVMIYCRNSSFETHK